MARIVVADASPLIGLAAAGAFDVPRRLFGTVTITRLVKDEIESRPRRPGARELDAAMRAALKSGGSLTLGVDHEHYRHELVGSPELRKSLAADLD